MNVMDARFAAEQARIFEADKAKSRLITFEEWKSRPAGERIKEAAAGVISRQL